MEQKNKVYSFSKNKIKILLLEGIHENSVNFLKESEYTNLEYLNTSLEKEKLIEKIKHVHMIGIRSRTNITEEILSYADNLIAIGCYSIGTNQVDLHAAKLKGIPVFNAPFSNTRSVAELVISECIMLMRRIPEKNAAAHEGKWFKDAHSSYEIRGKNIGIVGYGHIGSQVSILAENLGMNIYYYDIEKKLSLGNAKSCTSLKELLKVSDVLTLHVPETELTKNMITKNEFSLMRKGACIINASRGSIINITHLTEALKSKRISGAAVDVFPEEPSSVSEPFKSPLQNIANVILTPHIGGSTVEAQENIALEVSEKLINYSNIGSTLGATNFVEVSLPPNINKQRFLHIHKNKPGVMNKITTVFTSRKINIASQYLQTDPDIGYVIIDIDSKQKPNDLLKELKDIPHTIKARMLF